MGNPIKKYIDINRLNFLLRFQHVAVTPGKKTRMLLLEARGAVGDLIALAVLVQLRINSLQLNLIQYG